MMVFSHYSKSPLYAKNNRKISKDKFISETLSPHISGGAIIKVILKSIMNSKWRRVTVLLSFIPQVFERILFIWAIRHPASGYVQGINDLVTPFFVVFLSEFVSKLQLFLWVCVWIFSFFLFLDLNYLCQNFNPGLHRGLAMVVPLLLCFCHNNDDHKGVTAPEKQKMLSENIMWCSISLKTI